MRLKEDKTSWRAGGIIKRDNNQDKSVDGPCKPKGKKKDTKTWCRGKVGKKHKLGWRVCKRFSHHVWREKTPVMEMACETCDKQFDIDFGWWGRPKKNKEKLLADTIKKLYGEEV